MKNEPVTGAGIDEGAGVRASERLAKENDALKKEIERLERELLSTRSKLDFVCTSRTYRMAQRLKRIWDLLLPPNSLRIRTAKRAWRLLKRVMPMFKKKRKFGGDDSPEERLLRYGKYQRMDVVTTKHTMYVARLVKKQLERLDIECRIHVGEPEEYQDIPYVIICPQFVRRFPAVYFAFQMEQTVSSRWFTEEYVQALENSCGVLDYSLANIEFFSRPQYQKISKKLYYLPIDYIDSYTPHAEPQKKEYDVLFYGDANSDRRKAILDAVSKRFKVKVCCELYGEDIYREIRKAKVLLNIHYYENALLETTRLFETLSLNSCMIVSEDSSNPTETGRLEEFIDFVPVDDVDALISRIAYWVENDEECEAKVRANQAGLEGRANAFSFYFYRFLLSHDRIDFDTFYRLAGDYVQLRTNRLCLSLPESMQRRRSFDRDNLYGFECVPGLRHQKGWVGCGLSYKMIFTKALEAGMKEVMICEDDVIFPADFAERLDDILKYLHTRERWSLFSGVMADVGNLKIRSCDQQGGASFVQIDRMISTVFNIYNHDMFEYLRDWNEHNRDEVVNAIDRYLESKRLTIYVQVPFLVGHKEELNSTIWDCSNLRYKEMIENSEKMLIRLIEEYRGH